MSEKEIFKCEYCGKVLKSKAGKTSHEKSCKKNPINMAGEIIEEETVIIDTDEVIEIIEVDEAPTEEVEPIKEKPKPKEPKHITLLKSIIDEDGNINLTGNTLEQLHSVYVTLYNKEINYKCNNQARTMIASLTAYRLERL